MLSQHSKKHHHTDAANVVPDPLVDPGNPSHRHQARSTAHLDRPCSRLVALAAGSPGRCSSRPSQKENATVMLGSLSRTQVSARRPNGRLFTKYLFCFRAEVLGMRCRLLPTTD